VAREVPLEPRELLWTTKRRGPHETAFAVVLAGGVDIRRDGRLIDVMCRHEVFGLSSILGRPHTADVYAIPERGATVLAVDARAFARTAPFGDADVEHALLRLVARSAAAVVRRLNATQLLRPFERFVNLLRELGGSKTQIRGRQSGVIGYKQSELAQLINVDVGEVSRFVTYLGRKRLIARPTKNGRQVRSKIRVIAVANWEKANKRPRTKQLRAIQSPKDESPRGQGARRERPRR
jgi:class 3 adenylate cyclase